MANHLRWTTKENPHHMGGDSTSSCASDKSVLWLSNTKCKVDINTGNRLECKEYR